jgi:NADPH:quinone reductase-like Zn-dependent oxidoreductase
MVATAGPSSAARVRGYGARVVVDYHDPEWPARVRDASPGGRGVGAAVNAARGGAAAALQAVAGDGRLATITGDPPPPERGWRSWTSTSEPTVRGSAHWPSCSRKGCSRSASRRHVRSRRRPRHSRTPSPAASRARVSSCSNEAPSHRSVHAPWRVENELRQRVERAHHQMRSVVFHAAWCRHQAEGRPPSNDGSQQATGRWMRGLRPTFSLRTNRSHLTDAAPSKAL